MRTTLAATATAIVVVAVGCASPPPSAIGSSEERPPCPCVARDGELLCSDRGYLVEDGSAIPPGTTDAIRGALSLGARVRLTCYDLGDPEHARARCDRVARTLVDAGVSLDNDAVDIVALPEAIAGSAPRRLTMSTTVRLVGTITVRTGDAQSIAPQRCPSP